MDIIEEKLWKSLVFALSGKKRIFLYKWIQKYLLKVYKETMIVFLLSLFYKKKKPGQLFFDFLTDFIFNREDNPLLYDYIKDLMLDILKIQDLYASLPDLKNIEIVWDFHGYKNTKVLLIFEWWNKCISIYNYPTDLCICWLMTDCLDWIKDKLVYTRYNNFWLRDYIAYRNNFHSWHALSLFYRKFWQQAAFLLALRTTDLHYENVLISEDSPVFFDLECVFAPRINDVDYSLYLSGILDDPILTDSFWPLLWGRWIRKSVLTPILSDYWENPTIQRTSLSKNLPFHIPQSQNKKINPYLFYQEFYLGFSFWQKKVLKKKGKRIKSLKDKSLLNRILFRPTKAYFALLKDMNIRIALYDNVDIDSFLFEKLKSLPLFTNVRDINQLINSEIIQLKKGMVPIFYSEVHSGEVIDGDGQKITKLKTSCREEFINHINNLNDFYKMAEVHLKNAYKK